jgi:hypothetical protein
MRRGKCTINSLRVRCQHPVADPLRLERVLKALKINLEYQEGADVDCAQFDWIPGKV